MKITNTHAQLQQVKTLTQSSSKNNTTTEADSITFSPDDWVCHKAKISTKTLPVKTSSS